MKKLLITTGLILGLTTSNALAQRLLNIQDVLPEVSQTAQDNTFLVQSSKAKMKKRFGLHAGKSSKAKSQDARKGLQNRRHTGRSEQFNNPTELLLNGTLIDKAIYLNT